MAAEGHLTPAQTPSLSQMLIAYTQNSYLISFNWMNNILLNDCQLTIFLLITEKGVRS
uniref:Uncharacterized protein n=1 Tax=Arundo donax TaxID=35708 RepID=A0A0A9E817_ARUDO